MIILCKSLLIICILLLIALRVMLRRISIKVATIKDYLCANLSHGMRVAVEEREFSDIRNAHHGMSPFRMGNLEFLICVVKDGKFREGKLKDKINVNHLKYLIQLNQEGAIILRTIKRDNEVRYVCQNVIVPDGLGAYRTNLMSQIITKRQKMRINVAIIAGVVGILSNWDKIMIFLNGLF